jgi:DNA-binding response OmpR family regulator
MQKSFPEVEVSVPEPKTEEWTPGPEEVRQFSLRPRAKAVKKEAGGPRRAILLVEDNPSDAGLVRAALEEHGVNADLTHIENGEHAVEYIRMLDREPLDFPDLVIIDLNLPKRSGAEVLQAMGESAKGRGAMAVILTSSDARSDRAETIGLGATRYIHKPSGLEEFLSLGAIFKAMLEEGGTAIATEL